MSWMVDQMQRGDWVKVRAIYQEGLDTGLAAFVKTAPIRTEWEARHLPFGRLVARQGETVLGWGALGPVAET